jgi:hypothetical protein
VRISAPKRTAKITPTGVTWVAQEEDPAMAATSQARPQVGPGPQNGAQDAVVLQHESKHFVRAVPTRAELETSLDSYGKKAKLSLMMLIGFDISSSYTIGTPCVDR